MYLTSPTLNSSAKSNRLFFIAKEEVFRKKLAGITIDQKLPIILALRL